MAPSKLCFFPFFLFFLLQLYLTKGDETCQQVPCGIVYIDFPFWLDQPSCCGFPNFNLSCTSSLFSEDDRTMITFPFSGEFNVDIIGYSTPSLLLSDPNDCIPKRLLQGLNLSGTPFELQYPESYIFFNCSSKSNVSMGYPALRFFCLSNSNFSVWAIPTTAYNQSSSLGSCREMARILVPLRDPYWAGFYLDQISLTWENPKSNCHSSCSNTCAIPARNCINDECSDDLSNDHFKKKSDLSSGTKYAIIVILGVPFFLIVVCIVYYNVRVRYYGEQDQDNVEMSSLRAHPRLTAARTVNGLDESRIEAYPITLLGESYRLPRPNDNTCSICLSEYQPKETIRTIPDCNHYFHANCIDEWLKLKAACPVCRKTPDQDSALITYSVILSSASSPTL